MHPALDGLNDAQLRAALAVRGPVCILAGAGTGKTTTITRRIAWQVASGTFRAERILAVTFTDRAAREMAGRLARLGIERVRAKTFHAEALGQVIGLTGQTPKLLDSKGQIVYQLVRRLPAPYKFRATKDVAAEIEWAKARRVDPSGYEQAAQGRATPLPADLMTRVYGEYERRKRAAGLVDFEDLIGLAVHLLTTDPSAAARVRERYAAFTVDEYQDVNPLQQALLDAWLQGRDDVCVVGDDYQSIFGFTGAGPGWLLDFPRRYPDATVVTLEENYRSTAQVLALANRLTPSLGGSAKNLRPTQPDGPEPELAVCATGADEVDGVVARIRRLRDDGVALDQIAILYRINGRSEDFEEVLSRAGIPFQVRDGSFLRRPGPRALLAAAGRADPSAPAASAVRELALALGWEPDGDGGEAGAEEATRQADLARLVRLAADAGTRPLARFRDELRATFSPDATAAGVVLSTYHRAKGLEFDAVFLPRLEERELPFARSRSDEEVAEERRLLYVGITRARRHLTLSWARVRDGKTVRPSRFLTELAPRTERVANAGRVRDTLHPEHADLFERLRAWRQTVASETNVPAYVVFHDATLRAICERRPSSLDELARVPGVGPNKLARYGADVLATVRWESP